MKPALAPEIKLAARGLRRTASGPVAIAAMAGAALAVALGFAFVRTVLLSPLPYRDAERLVVVFAAQSPGSTTHYTSSPWNAFRTWRDGSDDLEHLAAQLGFPFHLMTGAGVEQVGGLRVTQGYFELLGARAAHGRLLTENDYDDDATRVVVLSHGTWQRRFGGALQVIGQDVRLEDLSLVATDPSSATDVYTIVGVAQPDFWTPRFWNDAHSAAELWVPFRPAHDMGAPDTGVFDVVGRLSAGASPASAQEELRALAVNTPGFDPTDPPGTRVIAAPTQVTGAARAGLSAVLGAAALLMAVACANTGILLGARARGRGTEFRTIVALGAPTGRLARLVAAEAAAVAATGAAIGLVAAWLLMPAIVARMPAGVPRASELTLRPLDGAVAVATAALMALAFGALPTWHHVRTRLAVANGVDDRSSNGGRGLLAIQIGLGAVLLVGTIAATRTAVDLQRRSLGFVAEDRILFELGPPPARYPNDSARRALTTNLLGELRNVPGVAAAEFARNAPLDLAWSVELTPDAGPERRDVRVGKRNAVTPGYHAALGIPVIAGRSVAPTDTAATEPVVVLNSVAATSLFADEVPIGRRVVVNGVDRTVVGIVGNTAGAALGPTVETAYLPFDQVNPGRFHVVVRATPDAADRILDPIREAIARVDPQLPLLAPRRLVDHVDRYRAPTRFLTWSLVALSAIALLILTIGSLGVAGVEAGARLREIGVRQAVGSTRMRLVGCLLSRQFVAVVVGAAAGTVVALTLDRLVLSGIASTDATHEIDAVMGAGLVGGLTLLAAAGRFWQAARASPADLLRRY